MSLLISIVLNCSYKTPEFHDIFILYFEIISSLKEEKPSYVLGGLVIQILKNTKIDCKLLKALEIVNEEIISA